MLDTTKGLKLDIALEASLCVELFPIDLASTTLLDDSLAANLLRLLVLGLCLYTGLVMRVEAHHYRPVPQRVHLTSHLPHLVLRLRVTHDALDLRSTESELHHQLMNFRYLLLTYIAFF